MKYPTREQTSAFAQATKIEGVLTQSQYVDKAVASKLTRAKAIIKNTYPGSELTPYDLISLAIQLLPNMPDRPDGDMFI